MQPDDDIATGNNDSTTFYSPGQPEGQAERIAEENAAKSQSYPIMAEVYKWFEDQADACNSIEQAMMTMSQYNDHLADGQPKATLAQVLVAHDIVRTLLLNKADEFKEYRVETD